MKKEIITENGIYSYDEIKLYDGRKILNPEIGKRNLLDFKKVMDKHGIVFGLWFGTLLGAVREKNFIEYDEDIDIFILNEDRKKVLNALFDLENIGLKVVRYNEKKGLLSIIRDDEYIDMYFYRKVFNMRRMGPNTIESKYLENMDTINFLGEVFPVPANVEDVLTILYGKDWKVPKRGGKPINKTFERKVKIFMNEKLPFVGNIYRKFIKPLVVKTSTK